MGFMDFIKKRSDSGMGSDGLNLDANMDFGSPAPSSFSAPTNTPDMSFHQDQLSPSMNMSSMGNTAFGQSSIQSSQGSDIGKDLEMISLKLDAIKSELDAMNQRLKSLETIAEREQSKSAAKKWY